MASSSPPRGKTTQRRGQQAGPGERAEPRLPHEHDESSDSQAQGERGVIHQAKEDLDRGLVDTGRGPEADRAYEQQKGSGVPGSAPAAPDQSGAGRRRR